MDISSFVFGKSFSSDAADAELQQKLILELTSAALVEG